MKKAPGREAWPPDIRRMLPGRMFGWRGAVRTWWWRHCLPMFGRAECGHLTVKLGALRYRDGCSPWKVCPRCHRNTLREDRRRRGSDV